jgi:hypothetical protein
MDGMDGVDSCFVAPRFYATRCQTPSRPAKRRSTQSPIRNVIAERPRCDLGEHGCPFVESEGLDVERRSSTGRCSLSAEVSVAP